MFLRGAGCGAGACNRSRTPRAGLLAHIVTAKFCDHTPLYRQSQIFAREGVELTARFLLAG